MKYVEVIAAATSVDTLGAVAETIGAEDFRAGPVGEDGQQATRYLVDDEKLQVLLDRLQTLLGAQKYARIIVMPVEMTLPKPASASEAKPAATAAREALYEAVAKNAVPDSNFIILTVLSTVVAAIGLLEDSSAVVIGAMVIAPLLGPNLALSLGTALGDTGLMRQAAKSLLTGLFLAVGLSLAIGMFWPSLHLTRELNLRTEVGLDAAALALASGAAAALSLTTGLSSVLVGVMVAVALLPPATTMGLMLGRQEFSEAVSAGLLLAVNIVCVNLASKSVFALKGIRPRTWYEKEKARRATVIYVMGWLAALIVLMVVIYARRSVFLR